MHGGKIYTFGGWEGIINGCINSIERLDVESGAKAWELFTIEDIKAVQNPIISSINKDEILIALGSVRNNIGTFVEFNREAYVLNE